MSHFKELDKELFNTPLYGLNVFDFSAVERNLALCEMDKESAGKSWHPKMQSTGTTIVASLFKDGVMLGADSRSTSGGVVSNKYAMKLHKMTNNIYAAGAGTAADLGKVTELIGSELKLYELNNEGKKARVVMANRRLRQYLFQYQGHVGCYLLVAGVDATGSQLYEVHADGYGNKLPFSSDGSGGYAAIAELENGFKPDMTEAECRALIVKAVEAGMHGDNMSGNTYNISIITKEGKRIEGPFVPKFARRPNELEGDYSFAPGTTKVIKSKTLDDMGVVVCEACIAKSDECVECMEES